jgi:sulfatase maturation enzyme AslB (radical SAM superfamily)
MNPAGPDIVDYFFSINPKLSITISTNGGARGTSFWSQLAQTQVRVIFCLDGLDDTHHLYRQNTLWTTVINNAKTFINAGGHAVWGMIPFDHNRHQIEICKQMSLDLGFKDFILKNDGRDTAPVFDHKGTLTHVLGNYQGETDFKVLFQQKTTTDVLLEDIVTDRIPAKCVNCETIRIKSIYIAANGDVSPCCYTGFYPRTYGKGQYHWAANAQLIPLMDKNNALEFELSECIEWFKSVQNSWKKSAYEQGRLVICDDNCGQKQ